MDPSIQRMVKRWDKYIENFLVPDIDYYLYPLYYGFLISKSLIILGLLTLLWGILLSSEFNVMFGLCSLILGIVQVILLVCANVIIEEQNPSTSKRIERGAKRLKRRLV